jgi:HK97 gp10 family phage protein
MVEGVAQLTRNLTKVIPARVQQAARVAMEQGAEETVAMMKRLVPKKTGALRDSIGWTWGKAPDGSFVIGTVQGRDYKTMRITIYAGGEVTKVVLAAAAKKLRPLKGGGYHEYTRDAIEGDYARYIEFGTQKMAAKPFFFVSWRSMKKRVRSRITSNVRKAIKAEGGQ